MPALQDDIDMLDATEAPVPVVDKGKGKAKQQSAAVVEGEEDLLPWSVFRSQVHPPR